MEAARGALYLIYVERGRGPSVVSRGNHIWRCEMDKEHVKGAVDNAKGAVKDAAGKWTDDKKLQAEGKLDKAKGAAHNVAGDVKDAVKHADK